MVSQQSRPQRGFTLIELVVAAGIVALVASFALPSYTAYINRSRVPVALEALSSYAIRLEQSYQDRGSYGATSCALGVPTVANFTVSCTLSSAGQGYTATATGSGAMLGYTYSINQTGTRTTVAHPKGAPSSACWSTRGGTCDS